MPTRASEAVGGRAFAVLALAAGLGLACQAAGQPAADGSESARRYIQERTTRPAGEGTGPRRPARQARPLLDTGGWLALSAVVLSELDHSRAARDSIDAIYIVDTRLWVQWIVATRERYYVRLRKLTLAFDKARGFVLQDLRDPEALDLDLGFAEFPLGAVDARAGRQLVRTGRGISLSQILDGLTFTYPRGPDSYELFIARSLDRASSLDASLAGFDRGIEDRLFTGLQYGHLTESGARYYAYFFAQNDNTRSRSGTQNAFDFGDDTQYVGLGAEGKIEDWGRYYAEYIHERGSTFNSTPTPRRRNVSAHAFNGAIYYFFRDRARTSLALEYLFGSGDEGRSSVTSKFGGRSREDTNDRLFTSFGRIEAGLGLSPLLSNIHVIRMGTQFKPYSSRTQAPSDLLVGLDLREYLKDEGRGAISDAGATQDRRQLGVGVDAYVAWRTLSDLSVLFNYGLFLPGGAYPSTADDSTERFLLTTTLSF